MEALCGLNARGLAVVVGEDRPGEKGEGAVRAGRKTKDSCCTRQIPRQQTKTAAGKRCSSREGPRSNKACCYGGEEEDVG